MADAVVLPDLVGWSKEDAVAELESLDLNVEVVEHHNDGSQESGTVSQISFLDGRTVDEGSTVTVYVWE